MPRIVQLKLRLNSTTDYPNAQNPEQALTGLSFQAVYNPDEKHPDFIYGQSTPFGHLATSILAKYAVGLEVGQDYLVDIHIPDPTE